MLLLRVLLALVVFATDVAVARVLGPSYKGMLAILVLTPVVMASVAGLGLDYALNRHGHQDRRQLNRLTLSAAALALIGVAVVTGLLYSGAFGIRELVYRGYGRLTAPVVAGSVALLTSEVAFALASMYAMTAGRPVTYGWMRVLRRSPVLLAAVALLLSSAGGHPRQALMVLIWSTVGGIAVACAYGLQRSGFRVVRPEAQLSSFLGTALGAYPGRVAVRLQSRVDTLLLGALGATAEVGLYSVGMGIAEVLYFLSGSLGAVLFSRNMGAKGANSAHVRAGRVLLPIVIVAAVLVAVAVHYLLPFVYGVRFLGSIPLLMVLLPGTVAFSLMHTFAPGMVQLGIARSLSLAQATGLALEIFLCVVLIPRMGAAGAALASTVSYIVATGIAGTRYAARLGVSPLRLVVADREDFRLLRARLSGRR